MASSLRRRGIVLPAVAVLVAGGGAVAYASGGGSGPGYRTATVTTGDVEQVLTSTGLSAYVQQATPHFRTAGTVATVKVAVGDTVKAGQVLATLATTSLTDAVTTATAGLAKAKATLETDQASTSSTTTTASSTATKKATTKTATTSSTTRPSSGGSATAAEKESDAALRAASDALRAASVVCGSSRAPQASGSGSPTPSATPTASPTATVTPTSTATPGPSTEATCESALQGALQLQQKAAKAQQDLSRALSSAATTPSSTTTPSTQAAQAAQSSRQGSGSSATSKAARVTTDTAAVVAAQTALATAQADLAGATLTSPIAGTVAKVPYTAGGSEQVSDSVTVLGPGAVTVTIDVPLASIRSIKVGQPATVLADGATKPVRGTVTAISLLPATSTTSTVSYPVTVLVPAAGGAFVDGSEASVSILVATAHDVVTVPNSALSGSVVTVLSKGKAVRTRVVTGAKGALVTQVTSGLTAGQEVVIADLSAALPTSSTTTRNRFGGGAGGVTFGGPGGFGGGGFGGAPTTIRRG